MAKVNRTFTLEGEGNDLIQQAELWVNRGTGWDESFKLTVVDNTGDAVTVPISPSELRYIASELLKLDTE